MPKSIAVVSYDLDPNSPSTADAIVVRDTLNQAGYAAQLMSQGVFDETNAATFKLAAAWERWDGVVICGFYGFWNIRELIQAGRPVLCANPGYVDKFGLGEPPSAGAANDLSVVDAAHPIIAGAHLPAGALDIGNPVTPNGTSTGGDQFTDVLIKLLATGQGVLVAHKSHPLSYFGWPQMSQATPGGVLITLLIQTANWTFTGP